MFDDDDVDTHGCIFSTPVRTGRRYG